ncbi:MAG: hypothetical protein FWH55_14995 [Oscillospiraceae bacterium]|nr:hypothetical protein [Oscillospiraceae bacterium]
MKKELVDATITEKAAQLCCVLLKQCLEQRGISKQLDRRFISSLTYEHRMREDDMTAPLRYHKSIVKSS